METNNSQFQNSINIKDLNLANSNIQKQPSLEKGTVGKELTINENQKYHNALILL